jgi:hypothetical protein
VSYEVKVFVLTLAGCVLLAAAYLYVQDLLYIKATGLSPSQRERDRVERRNRPLTRSRYIGWSVLVGSALVLQAYMAVWSGEYKGWSKLIPLAWMISGGVPFYHLQKRWRKQQSELGNQVSGAARK